MLQYFMARVISSDRVGGLGLLLIMLLIKLKNEPTAPEKKI